MFTLCSWGACSSTRSKEGGSTANRSSNTNMRREGGNHIDRIQDRSAQPYQQEKKTRQHQQEQQHQQGHVEGERKSNNERRGSKQGLLKGSCKLVIERRDDNSWDAMDLEGKNEAA